jgi:hypothetical protein
VTPLHIQTNILHPSVDLILLRLSLIIKCLANTTNDEVSPVIFSILLLLFNLSYI